MRDQLKVQELMDWHLDSRDKELCQLCSQLQEDGTKLAALSLQLQEVISGVEEWSQVVEMELEEVDGRFDCHQGEIDCLKTREKDLKGKQGEMEGYIIGAGHKAKIFKSWLDQMEEKACKCGHTPSEVGEEFVSSEEEARTELSYTSARGSKYVAPLVENPIPLPVPAPLPSLQLIFGHSHFGRDHWGTLWDHLQWSECSTERGGCRESPRSSRRVF